MLLLHAEGADTQLFARLGGNEMSYDGNVTRLWFFPREGKSRRGGERKGEGW